MLISLIQCHLDLDQSKIHDSTILTLRISDVIVTISEKVTTSI